MKILPLGLQTLSEIYRKKAIYVDKTELIHRLVTTGKVYFLSRPRRFGKSLLVSTLQELFEANKKLFKGLWIEKKWNWTQKYPVIHISFASLSYEDDNLAPAIEDELNDIAAKSNLILVKKGFKARFRELILALSALRQQQVVILIDEYDKPIIEYLENHTLRQAKKNQKILKSFYSVLKDLDKSIRFLFVTGVSKFSKVSIFSDLNQLTDLTLEADYAGLTGYTETELIHSFDDYLKAAEIRLNRSRTQLIAQMKVWYDGYSWDGETRVYNPYGTLRFLAAKVFKNYWFASATPTFLMHQMKQFGQFDVEKIVVKSSIFEKYDLDNLGIIPLLFQTGYLTIQEANWEENTYTLNYPNKEVKESMYDFLVDALVPDAHITNMGMTVHDLKQAFEKGNLVRVQTILSTLLADLPFQTFEKSSEGLYHGLIHIVFNYLGLAMQSEAHSFRGRADVVVQTLTHIYIFEFKINKSAEEAFQQIIDNEYAEKYRAFGKPILAIGVNFNTDRRKMDVWKQDFV
jgi:Predicted AAA-ATPase/PD-(D/E)XK nuclease superfamily